MVSKEVKPQQQPLSHFEDVAPEAIRRIRTAVSESLAIVGGDPTRPQSVSRLLGLDKSLTWKLCRLVCDENPIAAVQFIPGKAGLKILLTALSKAGTPADMILAIRNATEEFDRITDLHAGDRERLGIMLANISNHSQRERAEAHRKLAFRGNCAIWGVQARVQICSNFIAPGANRAMVDLAWISGLVDFWRFRRDARWAIAAARKTADDGSTMSTPEIRAIDPDCDHVKAVPLMSDFCSKPVADMRIETDSNGLVRYELAEGPVGSTATSTAVVGLYGRDFARRFRAANDTLGEHFARLNTPAETLIHDLFVHRDLQYAMAPEIFLYSQLPGGPVFPTTGRDLGLLAVYDPIVQLGSGPPDVVTSEFSQYPKMVRAVFDRLGWKAEEFRGFRFRLRYPPIPTMAAWRYELPSER